MATRWKTEYTGPVQNRGTTADGKTLVSREELADFQRKYGTDKTLRDLLNADRTGRPPAPSAGRMAAGRTATDRDMAPMRAEAPKRAVIPGAPASQAEPIEPTMGSRLSSGLSDTAQKALAATGIAAGVGGLGYAALRAKRAADAAKAAEELRKLEVPAYAAAKRAEANQRAMSSMKESLAKDLAEDIGKGSVGRGTPMQSTATSAETGRRYTPAQAYAKGGSVRGAGIAQRGVKKCKVY